MKLHLLLTPMLIACSPPQPLAVNEPTATTASVKEASEVGNSDSESVGGAAVTGLPFSHGKSFRTLDEYLAHLKQYAAPIDQPWWREISPGVYEHVKRMPGAKPETATRAQLMERFGFKS